MPKNGYTYFVGPSYDLSASNKTVFTMGANHEVSTSLSNAAKLAVSTEIKGGLSTSIKFGPEIEFKHSWTNKYEIDLEKAQIKDIRADTTNIYNAQQFRATAGELGPTLVNQVDAAVMAKVQYAAYFALLLQLAATSLTTATAVKAVWEYSDKDPKNVFNDPFWGGTGGAYWGSWSTSLIDGFSWVSLATAWAASYFMDRAKRKTPERHKNFLNMDHNAGILMGVQSSEAGFGNGSWYQQNDKSVEIGCYDDMTFNDALTSTVFNLPAPLNKVPGRLSISQDGVELEGGQKGIENSVPNGTFRVKVAKETRVRLTKDTSFVGRPGGTNYGLDMQSGRVKLSLDQNSDLDLAADMVKLRNGASTSLALTENEATLSAQAIKLAAPSVNIVGAEFKPGQAKIGDLVCLITDVSALKTQAQEAADNMKRITESLASDAKAKAQAAADAIEETARKAKSELLNQAAELQSQIAFVKGEVARLNKMSGAR